MTKFRNAQTIKTLCERAEAHALRDQQQEPGAEHFLLAALELEDDTARLAFSRAGAIPDGLHSAIEQQYSEALSSLGLPIGVTDRPTVSVASPAPNGVFSASVSGQDVMQELAKTRARHSPLLGSHIVAIVASMPHGVAARALRSMGVDLDDLRLSAEAVSRERKRA
ncbi:ATP-dependent Clp protease ATP-binding subunit ClpA [Devosia subaequoris]|uniref:ATP-dependent Clp protease ATP-binding subunit ClpA n=1 Tax=Devosia subaequoris TaxID=395930 RepID=A0A7W6IM59_9HYPH|nr:Clp protease N-terminal domain-containing protein [Devosia subaequoris]MBB4051697.1 ATP-dependent Clp protease ATP-binding subunit ClpA [Devosia subaequoris]MCP1209283.1 Clp protease N-terminal domain-containing protein [Devosia subaequoris]